MWVRMPIASEAISSTMPRHDVRAGTPAIANVSRSAVASARIPRLGQTSGEPRR